MADPKPPTRDQLAKFLPDADAIRRFERLFAVAGDLTPTEVSALYAIVDAAALDAGAALARAGEAVDSLSRIAAALEIISKAPAPTRQENALRADYIDLSTTAPVAGAVGRIWWDASGTINVGMGNGNITQQVGEEFFVYGKASAAIVEGQLIAVTGAVGASGVITFAPAATALTDPNVIVGVATEDIPINGFGRVTTSGVVHGINTTGSSVGETWASGDVLWYNPAVTGGMTKVKPSAPNIKTQVAIVINAGPGGSGSLQVEVVHGTVFGGTDSNVSLGALATGQLIQYDAALGYWKNVAAASIAEPPIASGTTAQYWRGDKTWQDFFTQVRAATLTGLSTATNAVITAADTVLSAFGKIQRQISDHFSATSAHGVSGAVVGTTDSQTLSAKTLSAPTITGSLTHNGNNNDYHHDITNNNASIANGGTVDFANFSGMLVVNSWFTGAVTTYLCGGGSVSVMGTVGVQVGTMSYNSGVAGYRWTNNTGATITVAFFCLRTRPTA